MNLELSGARVRCPNCGEIYFQTTDLYDPRKILTGEMLEWIPLYGPDGLNWSLPFAASDLSEAVICEGCGGPIAPSGYLGLNRLHFPAGLSPVDPAHLLPDKGDPGMSKTPPAPEKKSRKVRVKEDSPEPVQLLCPMCELTFESNQAFDAHMTTHDMGSVQLSIPEK